MSLFSGWFMVGFIQKVTPWLDLCYLKSRFESRSSTHVCLNKPMHRFTWFFFQWETKKFLHDSVFMLFQYWAPSYLLHKRATWWCHHLTQGDAGPRNLPLSRRPMVSMVTSVMPGDWTPILTRRPSYFDLHMTEELTPPRYHPVQLQWRVGFITTSRHVMCWTVISCSWTNQRSPRALIQEVF